MAQKTAAGGALVIAGALSVATALVANAALDRHLIGSAPLRILVALLPVPFFVAFVLAEFRWIREQDEFHRRVLLDSLAIAFPVAIAEAVTLDALQSAGFLTSVTIGDAWPFMALSWVPALIIARRRYR